MAFRQEGFYTISQMGTPDNTAGSTRSLHSYTTNDDTAGVIVGGYFNAKSHAIHKGDIIMCSLDNDGTPMLRNYIVVSNTAGVVTIAAQNVA